jgi:hypothetical protein
LANSSPRAIEAFKAADAKRPRAKHACLIALAYTRRELWAEAELFLSICRQRATASDPLPTWITTAEAELRDKLALAGAAPVTIAVIPNDDGTLVTVSSFAPGETFAPRTIHLSPGTYRITAIVHGTTVEQEVVIADATPRTVTLVVASSPIRPPPPLSHRVAIVLATGGVALVAAGFAYDEAALQGVRTYLATTPSPTAYRTRQPELASDQAITIGLWTAGAAAIVTAAILRWKPHRSEPRVRATATPGGTIVTIGWSR